MSVESAETFLKKAIDEKEFRSSLYKFDTEGERNSYVKEQGFSFGTEELDEAVKNLIASSKELEEGEMIEEFAGLWKALSGHQIPQHSEENCEGSCEPTDCSSCGCDCS